MNKKKLNAAISKNGINATIEQQKEALKEIKGNKPAEKKKIIVLWKESEKYEVYSSLTGFIERHPQYKRETVTHWITRKGVPYHTDELMIVRANYIERK